jgi:hypothetical protein
MSGYTATFTLTRSGDTFSVYASTSGAYQHLVTLEGPSVTGTVSNINLSGFGLPGVNEAETTILSNFYVLDSASEDLSGLTGGTADAPIMLPATPVNSVSGDIGGNNPDSSFYSFTGTAGPSRSRSTLAPPRFSILHRPISSSCAMERPAATCSSIRLWTPTMTG